VTLPLKLRHNEQHAVVVFWRAKRLSANTIHSELHPVYGDACFMKPTVGLLAWWKKMLAWQKFASGIKLQSIVFQKLKQQPASFCPSDIQKLGDRCDKMFERNRTIRRKIEQ